MPPLYEHTTLRAACRRLHAGNSLSCGASVTDFPWFKTDVQEWIALSAQMTDEQAGVHMRLLCHAWEVGGLPTNDTDLRQIGRWSVGAWRRLWAGGLRRQWVERDGLLVNDALETKRSETDRRTTAARIGGIANAQRLNSKRSASAEQTVFHREERREEERRGEERESGSSLSLVTAREGVCDLSPGQLQASVSGLVGAWNNIVALDDKPFAPVTIRSHPKATAALRLMPNIDWWGDLFRRVAASDYLGGRVPGRDGTAFVADFWWCLDNAEKIASGRYDNRARVDGNEAMLARVLKDLA